MIGGKYSIIKEMPFDSERKRMSVVVEDENNMRFLITKGAPDVLLPRCSSYVNKDGTQFLKDKRPIESAIDEMAAKALRTIAVSIKSLSKDETPETKYFEKDLTFVGIYGMMDQPRTEEKAGIDEWKQAE